MRYFHYAGAVLIGLIVVTLYAVNLADFRYLFTPDSAAYIESARHFMAGEGLLVSAGVGAATPMVPLSLFPPGHPLLIALSSTLTGLDAARVAVLIAWFSWGLLPVALLFALSPVLDRRVIQCISLLTMTSPGMVEAGWAALSDTSFLLLIIIAFAFLLRAMRQAQTVAATSLFVSGLLCGAAYLSRNSGTAAFAAIAASFVVLALTRTLTLRAVVARATWCLAGALTVLVPLWVRNLQVFGTLQPYKMSPSDIGLLENIRTYLQSTLLDLSGLRSVSMLAWDGKLLVAGTLAGLLALYLARTRLRAAWLSADLSARLSFTLLGTYILAGGSMVILARTLYQWGEPINMRHVIQYDWALLGLVAITLATLNRKHVVSLSMLGTVFLLVLHYQYNDSQIAAERSTYQLITETPDPLGKIAREPNRGVMLTNKLKLIVSKDNELIDDIKALPEKTLIASNMADVFRIETGRTVRSIAEGKSCNSSQLADELASAISDNRPFMLILTPRNETLRSGCWEQLKQTVPSHRYQVSVHPYALNIGTPFSRALREEHRELRDRFQKDAEE